MKPSNLEIYQQYAKTCQSTDYGKPVSVRAHNRSVTNMYRTVEKAAAEGEQSIQALAILLDEPMTHEWLAFRLLDRVRDVPPELEQKCLQIIKGIANDPSRYADASGSREWLRQWEQKHQISSPRDPNHDERVSIPCAHPAGKFPDVRDPGESQGQVEN